MGTYMPFIKDEIPVIKTFKIDDIEYQYQIEYNSTADFYTMTVKDENETIIYTTKLVMEGDALHVAHPILNMSSKIIPRNTKKVIQYLNAETFDDVRLYVE